MQIIQTTKPVMIQYLEIKWDYKQQKNPLKSSILSQITRKIKLQILNFGEL